ncbi:hypothetical protein CC85DRAFT_286018 [Cutaneotrichosporon oleaginosum]|uniref:Uncharacterized protein n=1 Tax=Cutaneotrichosporon oleaginosum TaxID=879819 RepID=A0A0J0XLG6_9TREE|nr:uncharacterized protein CC85DRAFT_286018 [Cutaneotrichosporon oleaginosum]KLT41932.1 hypothetical protein CC85DRAFT_286018 [Cutaneotrichosporon oleaginosum]TXT12532.1 hypothetical protein COLE_02942 [Cutaneotrichosporon oleaginosum]
MGRGPFIFQIVMYVIAMIIAGIEIGICTRFVVRAADVDPDKEYGWIWMRSIGGIGHGAVLFIYFLTFLWAHRRNYWIVRTSTDLILGAIFIASCILVGYFCAMIAFAPAAPLLLNFIVEAITVGRSKVHGKWRLSLCNVVEAKTNDYAFNMNQSVGTVYPAPPSVQTPFVGQPYAPVPNPGQVGQVPPPAYPYPYAQQHQQHYP